MIVSKKLSKLKEISHGFFNNKGGCSTGIYKSLNCGLGSKDNKTKVIKNLRIVNTCRAPIFIIKKTMTDFF